MRILFVLENYYPHLGGVEVVFKSLAEGLAKKGYSVDVITHRMKDAKKHEKINGVKIHRISCFRSRYWFTFLSIPKAARLAKKADIIHTTTYNGAFPAWIASKIARKPSIITVHEILGDKWEKFGMGSISAFAHKILEKMVISLNFSRFICVSKSTEKQLLKTGKTKNNVSVIYNGVDYSFWNPKKHNGNKIREKLKIKDKFVYLFFGRPGISKGLEFLVKAVPEISKKMPNSLLLGIVSKDRQYSKRYKWILSLISKLGIGQNVRFIEPVSRKELPDYVMAADCVVVPSLSEGFGFTAAESCAMGIPVVASNTTSLPEIVSGKYVLARPGSPKEIAQGVISISRGKLTEKPLKKFMADDFIKGYVSIYKKLI